MAATARSLVLVTSVPFLDDTPPINFYRFATADAAATAIAAGYFNIFRAKLNVNDVIEMMTVASGVGDRVVVSVTAVPASPGNITVATNGFAVGS